jgi:outer membrane protein OmpA-like peptidoglycan-associated protein
VLCGNNYAQQVQRANVYFKNNSAELNPTLTSLLDTIYNKLPEGKKIRIGLVGDGEDFR